VTETINSGVQTVKHYHMYFTVYQGCSLHQLLTLGELSVFFSRKLDASLHIQL